VNVLAQSYSWWDNPSIAQHFKMGGLHGDEIQKHNSKGSCWVVVHGKVYDVTEFLPGKR